MTIVEIFTTLEQLAASTPELVAALEELVGALRAKQPITPALKLAEAIAAAKALGLDPSKV